MEATEKPTNGEAEQPHADLCSRLMAALNALPADAPFADRLKKFGEIRPDLVTLYRIDQAVFELFAKEIAPKLKMGVAEIRKRIRKEAARSAERGAAGTSALEPTIEAAWLALWQVSDEERARDGVGFNREDHRFADQIGRDPSKWTPEQQREMWSRLHKYHKQLEALGILWREIPKPPTDTLIRYRATERGLVWLKGTETGDVEVLLCNFTAQITADVEEDDGVETRRCFEIAMQQGLRHAVVRVPAAKFTGLTWVTEALGARAILEPGVNTKDRARTAIQHLSPHISEGRVYTHFGWRKINDGWCYLDAGGAIGKGGRVDGIEVNPPDGLQFYLLPDPPQGEERVKAIRASLQIRTVAPPRVTVPLQAAPYCAVIGDMNFSEHFTGQTGKGKTALAALAQQHHGAGMDAEHLPANWGSTANSLELLAFAAKDALLVIDDFAPTGTPYDVQRLHREADRLLRAQANRSGRGRLRSDATLRPAKPPRGLIFSTGEDTPHGHSLRARMGVTEVAPGDVDWQALTRCQEDAAAGLYAQALASFVQVLAPRYEEIRAQVQRDTVAFRAQFAAEHRRTSTVSASIAAGYKVFLHFAVESGAITPQEADEHWREAWQVLADLAAAQAVHQAASDPARRFIELLSAAFVSGKAHLAARDSGRPALAETWGWRWTPLNAEGSLQDWRALGDRIGWVDGDDVYLDPVAAFNVARRLSSEQGEVLSVAERTLRKRLKEHGYLASRDEARETLTVRRQCSGQEHEVLHLLAATFSAPLPTTKKPDISDIPPLGSGTGAESPEQPPEEPDISQPYPTNPTSDPTLESAAKSNGHIPNVGNVGFPTGEETHSERKPGEGDLRGKNAGGNVGLSENENPTPETKNLTSPPSEPDPVEAEERRAIQEEDGNEEPALGGHGGPHPWWDEKEEVQ